MKIIQVVPSLNYGDAIGNNVIALYWTFKNEGYDSEIFSEYINPKYKKIAKSIMKWEEPDRDSVIIYHMAIGWDRIDIIKNAICKKIAVYHNVTPPNFFKEYDLKSYLLCKTGLREVKSLKDTFDYCICDSDFNKRDLISYGYDCPIDAIPILIAFDDYKKTPLNEIIAKWSNKTGSNILFVGRIVPNKKYEDIIASFYMYKKYYDKDARLFLVGSYNEKDAYYQRLTKYIEQLQLDDVYFSGHIKFEEILAYYSIADLFLCLSEHEGFCVPLVEAMYFNVPIVAYDSCAVGETLGDGGILLKEKNFLEIAGTIDYIVHHDELKKTIQENQKDRLKYFNNERIKKEVLQKINGFINN